MIKQHRIIPEVLLDILPEGFLAIDDTGHILETNEAYCRISGYSYGELLKMSLANLEAKETHVEIKRHIKQATQLRSDYFLSQHRKKNGKIVDVENSISYSPKSRVTFIFIRDVTKQKKQDEALIRLNKIEKELRENEYHYRTLYEAITDGIMISPINPDGTHGNFAEANEVVCRRLGYTREEITHLSPRDIDAPESQGGTDPAPYLRELNRGRVAKLEQLHIGKDGRRIFVEILARPFVYKGKKAIFAIVRDITERKRDEEKLRRLNRELRAISDCNQALVRAEDEKALLDNVCRVICDEAGYRMTWAGNADHDDAKSLRPVAWAGTENEFLASSNFTWADGDQGQAPEGRVIRSGESVCIQDIMIDPTAAASWRENALKRGYHSMIALPLKDESGHVFGALMIYSAKKNAFTSDETRFLGELAKNLGFGMNALRGRNQRKCYEDQLKKAKEAAEAASIAKSRFLDMAAHELRTPITAFSLLLQLAKRGLEKGRPVDAFTFGRIQVQADRLSRLVTDLLEVSRLERGIIKMKPEPVELRTLISECIENFTLIVPARRFIFSKPENPIEICIDPARIYQILSNLLDNAIKYTPEDTPIEVALEIKPNGVRVSITDHGPGITEQQQAGLFNPFSRGDSDQVEQTSGLGLGLFISRGIVELHGGTIGVTSKLGVGSTFFFELPITIASRKVA